MARTPLLVLVLLFASFSNIVLAHEESSGYAVAEAGSGSGETGSGESTGGDPGGNGVAIGLGAAGGVLLVGAVAAVAANIPRSLFIGALHGLHCTPCCRARQGSTKQPSRYCRVRGSK